MKTPAMLAAATNPAIDEAALQSTDAYPADTSPLLFRLLSDYEACRSPIEVSFRDMVPWVKVGERATHYLHSYPAKLLPQIAHFFLAANRWIAPDARILDPFGGTGTVALEANLSGRSALFADANPLARLIASAKTTVIDCDRAETLLGEIQLAYDDLAAAESDLTSPWVINIDLWYSPTTKTDLTRLRAAVTSASLGKLSDFVWATFSAVARKASRADPRFAVPVQLKVAQDRDVWQVFREHFLANVRRQRELKRLHTPGVAAESAGNDARNLREPLTKEPLKAESVDLILTSPPYASAQKYVRASSLSLGWLGLTTVGTLKELENSSIGREHFSKGDVEHIPRTGIAEADHLIETLKSINRTRATICANYLVEMEAAIIEMERVLKAGGRAVVVIGDNTVCGRPFRSSDFLTELFARHGMALVLRLTDKIKSRGLLTKRSGGAAAIQSETILVFQK